MASIIIPAYNEERRIQKTLDDLIKYKKFNKWLKEIIVVDDGSIDSTKKIVNTFGKEIRLIEHKKNGGKGVAIKTGILHANFDYIIFMDADGSLPLIYLKEMKNLLRQYPIVAGIRKKYINKPFFRYIASKVFNFIVNFLFSLDNNDILCGFKGFRKDVALELFKNLKSERWVFDAEILKKAKERRIPTGKVFVTWKYKKYSKMKVTSLFNITSELIQLKFFN